jgi:predicted acyl esterase
MQMSKTDMSYVLYCLETVLSGDDSVWRRYCLSRYYANLAVPCLQSESWAGPRRQQATFIVTLLR